VQLEWHDDPAVCVVLTAGGYPGGYAQGKEIRGLEKLEGWGSGFIFHAGTRRENNRWVTHGGRVLGVTARGKDIKAAVDNAYRAIGEISWDGMHYRRDIGQRAWR
jgi:phosphoribosylamine--glycine ligase